jgi:hypothetical protein
MTLDTTYLGAFITFFALIMPVTFGLHWYFKLADSGCD